ncbi:hypothetical protein BDN70DRAFT_926745 [Pholiota conissans]|uniref:BHLH domain-containing protein n=1 Tax=Pholiota conissans TaxID=109636 RepID=A0A9P6D8C1_9AGAR|nr:hypothetical protein BDN70DRAFT_926745 [Pholiota conissans]
MSTSHMAMDYAEHKPYPEHTYDTAFGYMESGLEYFQYPPSPMPVNLGLPQQVAAPIDLQTLASLPDYGYSSSTFAPSPPNAFSSQEEENNGVAPQALFYGLSGGEMSDGMASANGRVSRGSGSRSPAGASFGATVPRSQRFNPIAVPASRPTTRAQVAASHRRSKSSKSNDIDSDDDEDEEFKPTGNIAETADGSPRDTVLCCEIMRKQCIESNQCHCNELRDGYNRLKTTLPATNQKTSKVSLLDRATAHIRAIEAQNRDLLERAKGAEHEVHRLRTVNEALMLNRAGANINFN